MKRYYTDIGQSKKLAEILPLKSADMWYSIVDNEPFICLERHYECEQIPCWSLHTLLNVLPYPHLSKYKLGSGKEEWMVSVYSDNCRYDSWWQASPVDACYEMILKSHELNLL